MNSESVVFSWLLFSGVVAYLATTRGRNPALWFIIALFVSPLVAGIVLLVSPDEKSTKLNSRTERFRRLREEKLEKEEKEERRRDAEERRLERQQAQQIHAALLSKLAGAQPPQTPPAFVLPPQQRPVPPQLQKQPPPLPPPLPDELPPNDWFVVVDGVKTGPLSLDALAKLATSQRISGESLIWREGYPGWSTLKSEKPLVEAIRSRARKPN